MKVSVNRDLCSGHGRCYALAPDVFTSDDDGYAEATQFEAPAHLTKDAELGAESCPEQAIVLLP